MTKQKLESVLVCTPAITGQFGLTPIFSPLQVYVRASRHYVSFVKDYFGVVIWRFSRTWK